MSEKEERLGRPVRRLVQHFEGLYLAVAMGMERRD